MGMGQSGTGDSDSGSGQGSASGGSGCGSTPFLQIVRKNGQIDTLNDIMVTSPSSMFFNPADGKVALAGGKIGFDVYPVSVREQVGQSEFTFKLKEIEYETSTIAEFSYTSVHIPKDSELATDHSHNTLYTVAQNRPVSSVTSTVKTANLEKIVDAKRASCNSPAQQPIADSVRLLANDEVCFSVKKASSGQTHIAVGAFFSALHTGGADAFLPELQKENHELPHARMQKTFFKKSLPFVGSLALLMAAFLPGRISLSDTELIQLSNTIPHAHAETGGTKSLYFYYKNNHGSWTHFSTYHPRFNMSYRSVTQVPFEAFAENQTTAEIKIISNTEHYIHSVCAVDTLEPIDLPEFTSVALKDGEVIASDSAVVTQPGDDLAFTVQKKQESDTHFFFKIQGHYSPLHCQSHSEANQWWQALTAQEKKFLVA
jgi:hypothetical protein